MDKDGFRVSLLSDDFPGLPKKYYIYVDLKNCKVVGDLETHVKKTFEIKTDITLAIGDNCLPRNETIMVIEPNDVLRLQMSHPNDPKYNSNEPNLFSSNNMDYSPKSIISERASGTSKEPGRLPLKKKSIDRRKTNYCGVASCLEILRKEVHEKKVEIEESVELKMCQDESRTPSAESVELMVTESEEISILETDGSAMAKKKRKRKHKTKKKITDDISDSGNIVEIETAPSSHVLKKRQSIESNKHMYFSDSDQDLSGSISESVSSLAKMEKDDDCTIVKEINGRMEKDDSTFKKEENDTWKTNLLALANEPLERKVFHRTAMNSYVRSKDKDVELLGEQEKVILDNNSCQDFDPLQYPVISKVKKNDVILFKMLKIGADYCPTMSGNIMGKIKSIDEGTQQLSILILRGCEEFDIPKGKLSIRDSSQEISNTHTATLLLHELIEPRLVFP